jgi:AraC-like DNA-binding protein/DNA gyrase inhibitor GyrI
MPRTNDHYQERVNRVLDYIGEHLDSDLSLARLSAVACFSPFHFHRIFQAVTGETLNSHVQRVRLERAAALLRASPRRRITEIALDAGFNGAAEFSRAFKNHFGRTASSWDRHSPLEKSKICKEPGALSFYSVAELEKWRAASGARVALSRCREFRYVYIRVFAPYSGTALPDAYYKLIGWLANRGTSYRDVVFIGMSLDDPSITPAANCRYDLGVAFGLGSARATPPSVAECRRDGFSIRALGPMEIASIHCKGDLEQVARAWQYLYRIWLPAGRYQPADLPAMELFVRIPEEIGWQTFDLKTCIPVVPF